MRKRLIADPPAGDAVSPVESWLDLAALARVEITSESDAHPIESALRPGDIESGGWRAAHAGEQTIRLLFDRPISLRRIWLRIREEDRPRTQEFLLRWSADGGRTFREIARQQYNFAPPHTTTEVEEYRVSLAGVTALELNIKPDISGGAARASLEQLRLA